MIGYLIRRLLQSVVVVLLVALIVFILLRMLPGNPATAVLGTRASLAELKPVAEPEAERAKEHEGVKGELPSAIDPPSGCRFRTRCPFAQEICAAEEPPLRAFTAAGHRAACHFPLWEPEPGAAAAEAVHQEPQQAAGAA